MGHRYTEPPRGKDKTAAIQAAREKLSVEERRMIDSLARYFARRAKIHGAKKFGAAAGLELLGKLAMLLEERLDV
jgi:hypothetical protein